MPIRSFWRAVKVEDAEPPYDTLHLKVLYPAKETEKEQQIFLPANSEIAPFPVIIFFNGANCSLEGYQWLGVELAKRGTVVILCDILLRQIKYYAVGFPTSRLGIATLRHLSRTKFPDSPT